jgi:hypothetical protein
MDVASSCGIREDERVVRRFTGYEWKKLLHVGVAC